MGEGEVGGVGEGEVEGLRGFFVVGIEERVRVWEWKKG